MIIYLNVIIEFIRLSMYVDCILLFFFNQYQNLENPF